MVGSLVAAAREQTHPEHANQSEWLECILMDDCSRDGTADEARRVLALLPAGSPYRLELNPQNLGLSRTVNRAFELARAPYVLTCHCDCLFGDAGYVARMLALMQGAADAGAITGKPSLTPGRELPFVERVNAVANMMDILPPGDSARELVPIGFAEGRCDIFSVAAMRAAGMYQTSYRTAGEDQELAARMRQHGFRVYQATRAVYHLSVSDEQNTLRKLARHGWLFGKVHPLLLLADSGTRHGIIGPAAGSNRTSRAWLRLNQVASTFGYALILASLTTSHWSIALAIATGLLVSKAWLFRHHLRVVPFSPLELVRFFGAQPLLDVAYTCGLCAGVLLLARGWRGSRTAV